MKQSILIPIVCITALAAGLLFGLTQRSDVTANPPKIGGFAYPEPKSLVDLALVDQDNKPFTEQDFKGFWTFVYVGYTYCPDACPIALATMNQLDGRLTDVNSKSPIRYLLVSIDPHRDTPERLKEYVEFFNPNFIAATGEEKALKTFAGQVSAVYTVPEDKSADDYLVNHSSSVVLVNPAAQVHAIFTPPQKADDMAEDFKTLLAHSNDS